MAVARVLSFAGGIAVLGLSMYPGLLGDVLFASFFILVFFLSVCLPVLAIAGVVYLVRRHSGSGKKKVESLTKPLADAIGFDRPLGRNRSLAKFAPSMIAIVVFLYFQVPLRVAFLFSRPAFDRAVTYSREWWDKKASARLGIYTVDSCCIDPRGGVYFRTFQGVDGISPDTMSHGFVFKPNPTGTPFGRAGYQYSHLIGDWYSFAASNDY
jgi:hypothetical protein